MPSQSTSHGGSYMEWHYAQDRAKAKLRHHTLTQGIGKQIRDAMEENGCTEEEITSTLNWMLDTAQISRKQAENFIYSMKAEAKAKDAANPNWREELRIERLREQEQKEQERQQKAQEEAEAEEARIEKALESLAAEQTQTETVVVAKTPSKPISGSTVAISVSFAIVAIVIFTVGMLIGRHIREEWNKPPQPKGKY